MPASPCARDRVAQALVVVVPAPRRVRGDDPQAMPLGQIGQVVERHDGVAGEGDAAPQELRGDHRHAPVDAGHADAVTALRADRAGDVRPVIVARAVEHRVVAVLEVPAVDVVDVPVAVVIDAVHRIERVRPDVRVQIGMRELHAGVGDAHVDVPRSGVSRGPRLVRLRPERVRERRDLIAVHAPQVPRGRVAQVVRIVRRVERFDDRVELRVAHVRLAFERRDRAREVGARRQREPLHVGRERRQRRRVQRADGRA